MSALCNIQNKLFFIIGRASLPSLARASLSLPPLSKHYLLWPMGDQVLIFDALPWWDLTRIPLETPCQCHLLCGEPSPEPRMV